MPLPFNRALDLKLVRLVEEHPMLYNPSHPSYLDADAREVAWQKIGDTLNRHAPFCKHRWVNIRDIMRRRIRERQNSTNKNICKYKYEDELRFMMPFFKDTLKTGENYAESVQEDYPLQQAFVEEDTEESKVTASFREAEFNQDVNPLSVNSISLNALSSDPIEAFLITIGSTLKKLNPYYLNQAKSKIFQIVQDSELKQMMNEQENNTNR